MPESPIRAQILRHILYIHKCGILAAYKILMDRVMRTGLLLSIWLAIGMPVVAQHNDVAFAIGSYDRVIAEVKHVGPKSLWIVEDMDEGTSFVVVEGSQGLSVTKSRGIIWISSIHLKDKTTLTLLGQLPLKITSNQYVQFSCPVGKFIYLYDRRP